MKSSLSELEVGSLLQDCGVFGSLWIRVSEQDLVNTCQLPASAGSARRETERDTLNTVERIPFDNVLEGSVKSVSGVGVSGLQHTHRQTTNHRDVRRDKKPVPPAVYQWKVVHKVNVGKYQLPTVLGHVSKTCLQMAPSFHDAPSFSDPHWDRNKLSDKMWTRGFLLSSRPKNLKQ